MNHKGFSTLVGLCYLIPMTFLMSAFFLLYKNEQQTQSLYVNSIRAQYIAESAAEKTFALLCSDPKIYDDIRREAYGQTTVYEKELYSENRRENDHEIRASVRLRFFSYGNSVFTLNALGSFDNTPRRIIAYIKESNHQMFLQRWDYHEDKL